jgi:alcohol dehydrogenase class IV
MSLGEYTLSYPIWVEFGNGKSSRTGPVIESQGWEQALVVTDRGIREAGILDGVATSLEDAGIEFDIYDSVEPNPTVAMVEDAAAKLSAGGYDVVVAVGGGSVIDTAKCATLLVTNDGDLSEYEVNTPEDVTAGNIENDTHPLVTIPTTAGTGSEVDYWAVITAEDRNFKMAIGQGPLYPGGPYLGADISLVDPELTASLPPRQTAATGFDAFSHALENHVAAGAPELVKPYTTHVMGLVPEYLPDAYETGHMEAREQMLFGSHMAGFCENFAGFGAIHSLAEVTGGMYPDIPHGEAIAVFTPPVMRYNLEEYPARYAEVAAAMGVDTTGLSDVDAAHAAVEAVQALIDTVDLPSSLRELDVDEEHLEEIAETSLETIEIHDNPRDADAADLLDIARNAY